MFPDPSGATTPVAPLASQPQEHETDQENANKDVARGLPPSWSGSDADGASVKSPEPHWDPVIGAATD